MKTGPAERETEASGESADGFQGAFERDNLDSR